MTNFENNHQINGDLGLLSGFTDALPEAACILRGFDNYVVLVNKAFLQLTGLTVKNSIGISIDSLKIWVDRNIWTDFLKKKKNTPGEINRKIILRNTKDESFEVQLLINRIEICVEPHFLVRLFKITYRTGEGSPLGGAKDITEQKQTEEKLLKSEMKYRGLFDSFQELVSVYEVVRDKTGVIVDRILKDANASFIKVMKAGSLHEIANKTGIELYGKELAELHLPVLRKVMESKTAQTVEGHNPFMNRDFIITYTYLDENHIIGTSRDITPLKEAERNLRKNEEKLVAIMNATTETIWLIDLEGNILSANPTAASRFGLKVADVVGKNATDLLSPELWRSRKVRMDEMVASNDIVQFEDERDNIIFRHSFYPVRSASGSITATAMFSHDITDNKRAENALKESEQRFRAITSSTPDHIIVQDKDLRYILVVNPQLGLTEQDMIGKTDYDFLAKEDADNLILVKRGVLETGRQIEVDLPLTDKAGNPQYFNGYYVPKFDSEGNVDGIIGYFRNVTENKLAQEEIKKYAGKLEEMVEARTFDTRKTNEQLVLEISERIAIEDTLKKQAEELEKYRYKLQELVKERTAELESNNIKLAREIVDRRHAEKALTESERKFREIAQNVPGMIFQLRVRQDGSNYFTYMSPRAAELFELPLDPSNLEWSFFDHIHPDDKAGFMTYFTQVITNITVSNYEGRIILSNGETKWFHGFTSPTYVGTELVLDGIMLDITDRKIAEKALMESEKRYRTLFNLMTEGFALHEIICDDQGKPVDYIFLDINNSFEQLTGLKKENIIGKKLSEVLPNEDPKWVEFFGNVALTGKPVIFENYSEVLHRHYEVHSFSPAPLHFAVIFRDITNQKKTEAKLQERKNKKRS